MAIIPLYNVREKYQGLEEEFLAEQRVIMSSGKLFDGEQTEQLEAELASFCGYPYAITVSSGTMGLYLTSLFYKEHVFNRVKVKPVALVTPFTYQATHNALHRAGFELDFDVDINLDTFMAEPSRTKLDEVSCFVPVGLFGQFDKTQAFPRIFFEDACQSWITYTPSNRSRVISFDPTKTVSSIGNGGAVLTYDIHLANFIKMMRSNSLELEGSLNARMSELEAAYVRLQLPNMRHEVHLRRKIFNRYKDAFGDLLVGEDSDHHDYQKAVITLDIQPNDVFETKRIYQAAKVNGFPCLSSLPIYGTLSVESVNRIIDECKRQMAT